MRNIRRVLLGIVATLTVLVGTGAVGTQASAHDRPGSFVVKGDVAHRRRLTAADLATLPQKTLTVTFKAGAVAQTHTYVGPLLLDVLGLAGPTFDPAVKNDSLRHYVAVAGSDGYQVVVAWGELDPNFEAKTLLLATSEDGVSLADVGPRLVVPGDSRGGRYVSNVVSVKLAPTGHDG